MGSRAIVEICHDEASQHSLFCVADAKKEMSSLPGFNLNAHTSRQCPCICWGSLLSAESILNQKPRIRETTCISFMGAAGVAADQVDVSFTLTNDSG
ncbi:hypothetical protein M514_21435 [Trichuris suis]|uniref:Uncharacterized protein n=1 Tax=Trichuris suis TaxID=68888 RepID=A0A085NAA9_9BILA|nr:hypothetical protein M514_21435 [Trichuris suis]